MSWKRRSLAAAVTVLAALGLVGCVTIPGGGPVQLGLTDLREAEQYVQFNPLGPVAESSQEDIVRGFVLAASSSDGNYAVAREFLAPRYAEQWDPSLGVLIDDGSRPYSPDGDTAGVLELSAVAKVDAEGRLLPVAPGASTDMRFEFELVNGEWRISSAPSGIILDRVTFAAVWSSHQLYFVGATGLLVPENRWFLNRASLTTEVVNGLLAGPGERMAEVLHSGFPPGTKLAESAVTVIDGRALIDLTGEALEAGPDATVEMYGQLRESLRAISGVSSFEVTVNGTVLRDPAEPDTTLTPNSEALNPAVLRNGEFGTVALNEFLQMGALGRAIAEMQPAAVTLSADEKTAAVLAADGVSRVDAVDRQLVDARSGLLEPGYDLLGYIWTANRSGELQVASPEGETGTVAAPWLAGTSPAAVQISPDGSRIAALLPVDDDASAVYVAGVIRDEQGMPMRTTDTAEVQMWAEGTPIDLDWVDSQRFAVLSQLTSSKISVGGPGLFPNAQGSVPGGVQIASGGSRSQLRVLSSDGELYMSQGSGWQQSMDNVDVLAKRG